MKKFIQEFKEFALKGNMMDLAIGMIIGSAFTGIVERLIFPICFSLWTVLIMRHWTLRKKQVPLYSNTVPLSPT